MADNDVQQVDVDSSVLQAASGNDDSVQITYQTEDGKVFTFISSAVTLGLPVHLCIRFNSSGLYFSLIAR